MSVFIKNISFGRAINWQINCDAFDSDDWDCIADLILQRNPAFSHVEAVSKKAIPLSDRLSKHVTTGPVLLVDDVLNVQQMLDTRLWFRTRKRFHCLEVCGYVVFARVPCPQWVRALWQLDVRTGDWYD